MTVGAIHFTQEQARDLLGVSAEKLRHWRGAVTYLHRKTGKAARFSFGDLVGLAITRDLVDEFGVGISMVREGIGSLFVELDRTEVRRLPSLLALITPSRSRLCLPAEIGLVDGASILIPCAPLVDQLSSQVLPTSAHPQSALPFPPQALRVRA